MLTFSGVLKEILCFREISVGRIIKWSLKRATKSYSCLFKLYVETGQSR